METSANSRVVALLFIGVGLLFGVAAGLVVFFGLPAFGVPASPGGATGGATATPAPAPVVGAPAPDFTLNDLDGSPVTLSSLKGQVVLINFWATWCGPCEAEMPAFQRRYETFKSRGFSVLGVNVGETEDLIRPFVERLGLTFTILLDPAYEVEALYRVRGYPTTYIVNRDGIIVQQHVGMMTEGQLDQYLTHVGVGGE
jgi:peroxiredoxin